MFDLHSPFQDYYVVSDQLELLAIPIQNDLPNFRGIWDSDLSRCQCHLIGILEDSGYLARAALIADRTMYRIGLQGKSFIPLLSAYACAVPAIMATRTI